MHKQQCPKTPCFQKNERKKRACGGLGGMVIKAAISPQCLTLSVPMEAAPGLAGYWFPITLPWACRQGHYSRVSGALLAPSCCPYLSPGTATLNPARLSVTRGFIGRLKIPDSTPDPTISKLATVAKLTFLNTPNSRDSSLAPQELSVFTPDVRRVQRLHSRTPSEVLRVQDAPRAGGGLCQHPQLGSLLEGTAVAADMTLPLSTDGL